MPDVLPASETKHLTLLHHPIPCSDILLQLRQRSIGENLKPDNETLSIGATTRHVKHEGTGTTGTTLWLGAQVLACYLVSALPRVLPVPFGGRSTRGRVLELGSGTGYLSLVLASMGYTVLSTDIEPVLSTVLKPNVEAGLHQIRASANGSNGLIVVQNLDWTLDDDAIAGERFDMILMSDTIYLSDLNPHLFGTLRKVSLEGKAPMVYLALERRDSAAVDSALTIAQEMGFNLKRVAHTRVVKAVDGAGWGWDEQGWEDVEVWKGKWEGQAKKSRHRGQDGVPCEHASS
ncbi:putative methyltransferase-domain-containing protein [Kockovaella imperatae]|uniref:Putative methyltransferase-domain-containing protein n=1 Tax=Kockovaella imperatae TaxID=4999 RepID=A0A1Y1U8W6_9TREE|nr:putative methyltransferase-domain-containing protein [Kockovaella imperatae]ORX34481.1 putative methyltransferase-domain-containing protein [Kockovaella imperatae]